MDEPGHCLQALPLGGGPGVYEKSGCIKYEEQSKKSAFLYGLCAALFYVYWTQFIVI